MELSVRLCFENETVTLKQSEMFASQEDGSALYTFVCHGVSGRWRFTPAGENKIVTLELASDAPLHVCRADSLVFTQNTQKTDRVVFLGRDMNYNMIRFPHEMMIGRAYGTQAAGHLTDLTASGPLFAGIVPFDRVYKSLAVSQGDGRVTFCAQTTFTEADLEAKALSTQPVLWCENSTIDGFFTAYRALLPQSRFAMPKLTGWNTWDYYLKNVTPEDVAENARALKEMSFADKLRYIVIDDGWQQEWGKWRENEKFACGLPAVARAIREAGFLPGLWMAPFAVRKNDSLLREHPAWFCGAGEGEPMTLMNLYYLDPTHPEARAFMLDNYRYQYEAGFRLFKMDYVSGLLGNTHFYDGVSTPYGAIRSFVADIYKATGPDAVVLGCSLPPECGADVTPSMRIGVDIHNYFSHVEWIAEALTWGWMYNLTVCRIDPDFLIVRGDETSDETVTREETAYLAPRPEKQEEWDFFRSRWKYGNTFNAIEAQTWANLAAISGGNLFLSDRMSVLNARGIAIIEDALALAGETVRPRFLKEDQRHPSLWIGDQAMLVINWDDVPRTISIPAPEQAFDAKKPYTLQNGVLSVALLPHESFAALWR